jgi:hypothetical protein
MWARCTGATSNVYTIFGQNAWSEETTVKYKLNARILLKCILKANRALWIEMKSIKTPSNTTIVWEKTRFLSIKTDNIFEKSSNCAVSNNEEHRRDTTYYNLVIIYNLKKTPGYMFRSSLGHPQANTNIKTIEVYSMGSHFVYINC